MLLHALFYKINPMKYLLIFSLAIAFIACNKNKNKHVAMCDGSSPTYDSDVQLIVNSNCGGCHGAGSPDGDYSTYAGLSSITSNGKFESEVLDKQSMPTSAPLSDADLDLLKCWVDNGFPEN